jgi:secondary thiamine-phosphate synthase enzyme
MSAEVELTVATHHPREIIDLTEDLATRVTGLADGAVLVSAPHTTVALFVSELDEDLRDDYLKIADLLFEGARPFSHRKMNNPNTEAHALSAMFGTSVTVPVAGGRLRLGTYQRIILFELDGPKERTVRVTRLAGMTEL